MPKEIIVRDTRTMPLSLRDPVVSLPTACRLLGGISIHTLRTWIQKGVVSGCKVGKRRMLRLSEVESLVSEKSSVSQAERRAMKRVLNFREQLLERYHVKCLNDLPPGPKQDFRALATKLGFDAQHFFGPERKSDDRTKTKEQKAYVQTAGSGKSCH